MHTEAAPSKSMVLMVWFQPPEGPKLTVRLDINKSGDADALNELEWVRGEFCANVWQTDQIELTPR